ncbi:MAG: glycosyltransferase family 4 protein [Gemmatimonadales bacterium]
MAAPVARALIIVENNSVPFDRRVWREAQTLRDAGWSVAVISPMAVRYSDGGTRITGEDAPYELLEGIHVYRYPLEAAEGGPLGFAREYLVAFWWTLRLMRQVWRERGADVVQVCNPPDFFFPLGWLCRATGRAFVFDHHDLVPESVSARWQGGKGAVLGSIARTAERLTMRAAHVVISTNQSYREIALGRGRCAAERVVIVRNGPKLAQVARRPPDASLRAGRRYLVGYLGIMGPQDGLELLLDAVEAVVHGQGRRDVQFLVVGDGPMRPWLAEEARRRGVEAFVMLPGLAVGMDEWLRYLSAPDLCLAPEPPTKFNSHSTITKVAEYMAMGQPIVAFDLKETRHTAQDAAVYVAEPSGRAMADALLALLEDPDRRSEMARAGLERARTSLSWESQEPELLRAYELALRNR